MDLPGALNRPSVLIVVESQLERMVLAGLLKPLYEVALASTTREAWACFSTHGLPDLILLDEDLPESSSPEFCKQLETLRETRAIPLIILREHRDGAAQSLTVAPGIDEYLFKPIDPTALHDRIAQQLRLRPARPTLKNSKVDLEREIDRRSKEIGILQDLAVRILASLTEIRHLETENHARRTQHYVMALANHLAPDPKFADRLDRETRDLLFNSVPLHDIGKIGIPDAILLKAGPLSPDEREIMKTHTTLGRDAIQRAEDQLGVNLPFLGMIKELAYSHHERWDGHGYPEGRAGHDIPLSARLMAVADVYDALITRRVYKEPMSHDQVAAFIVGRRSTDFDPDVIDAFVQQEAAFLEISNRFSAS